MKGFVSALSRITAKPAVENYNTIFNNFLPGNAEILVPQFPRNSKAIQVSDLDGDLQNELIASYKHNTEIKTLILRKQNGTWYKAAEINHPEHDSVNFRQTADITGAGKKQLLVGLTSKSKLSTLYGYSFENNTLKQMFSREYQRFDLLGSQKSRSTSPKVNLAIWNKKSQDQYNIDVLHWNNTQLEPLKNANSYFYRNVVPLYVQKVKQAPHSPSNWYNLADALVNAGENRDALVAIEVGMNQDRSSEFKDKFLALKNKMNEYQ